MQAGGQSQPSASERQPGPQGPQQGPQSSEQSPLEDEDDEDRDFHRCSDLRMGMLQKYETQGSCLPSGPARCSQMQECVVIGYLLGKQASMPCLKSARQYQYQYLAGAHTCPDCASMTPGLTMQHTEIMAQLPASGQLAIC